MQLYKSELLPDELHLQVSQLHLGLVKIVWSQEFLLNFDCTMSVMINDMMKTASIIPII